MTTTHFNTKDRILGAAEELFAQYGFSGTSLRQVTSRADVNIAAVNYHFGSKENLVNEVFRRRMDEMSERRLAELRQAQEEHPNELEPILHAFIEPALALTLDRHGSAFVRVLARALRREERPPAQVPFRQLRPGAARVRQGDRALPARPGEGGAVLAPGLRRRRAHLRHGDFGLIKRPAGVSEKSHSDKAAEHLIRFAAAGLRAA
jgi:AcrR family transcriptional regulator